MLRVMIIGQPGSGKSTLALAIGEITGLPVFHIDHIHWQPGWVERENPEKDRLCAEVHARAQWIFEGGRSVTWRARGERCDTLIWLDYPLWIRAWRVLHRTLRFYGRSRLDLPEGCPEQFSFEFWLWIWNTRRSGRVMMARFFAGADAEKTKHRLTSSRHVARYLAELKLT